MEDARRILRISKGIITKVVRRFLRLEVGNMATATLGDNQETIILNMPHENYQRMFETFVDWSRFGSLFRYDPQAGRLYEETEA